MGRRSCDDVKRISGGEYFGERDNRSENDQREYKRVGTTNAHSHELEIILSRTEIGRHSPRRIMAELHYLSLATIAQKVRAKEITPQELAQHYLQRIER